MSSAFRTLGHLTLRRSTRSLPVRLPARRLPPVFFRSIALKTPDEPLPSTDNDPSPNFELVSSGSSNHPYAGINISQDPSYVDGQASEASSSSSGGSSDDNDPDLHEVATTLPPPPPPVPTIPPDLRHPFDTHAFVSYLEKSGVDHGQAYTLMDSVKQLIIRRKEKARATMLDKEDMENASYLFRAALSELRTELSVRARNDSLMLKQLSGGIRREVDSLEQKLKEDIQTLKHDIEMDMNNRKSETRSDQKTFDIAIEETNNKFTISLGDLRTEIEVAKWEATRRVISILILIIVLAVALSLWMSTPEPPPPPRPVRPPPEMKDEAIGTEDLMEDFAIETEKKLEKLLSHREIPTTKKRRDSKASRQDVDVDRI